MSSSETLRGLREGGPSSRGRRVTQRTLRPLQGTGLGVPGWDEGVRNSNWTKGCNHQLDVRHFLQGVPASPFAGKMPEAQRKDSHSKPLT